ncbi:unnamed protein product [Owenia fusiformis]|uniref:Uncharacterized protein n=1 Tax=Owenia fusiformis TaxID=6347 RepID=A0A8J1U9Z2_OWEFU|nr:unnamed protein product [Owenia fusiformis]
MFEFRDIIVLSLSVSIFRNGEAIEGTTNLFYPDIAASPGDFILGGIFPLHEFNALYPCGRHIRSMGSILRYQAMIFAIEEINRRDDILPNVTLGYMITDSCHTDMTASAQVLRIVIQKQIENKCSLGNESIPIDMNRVVGFIGPQASDASILVANILGVLQVPQISFLATTDVLSDRIRYSNFFRTVPSDVFTVEALVDLLKRYNWRYISAVYTPGDYGSMALQRLFRRTINHNICFGQVISLRRGANIDEEFDAVIHRLRMVRKARVVVLYISNTADVITLMKHVNRLNATEEFIWIGSDTWPWHVKDMENQGGAMIGSFALRPYTIKVPEFDNYFTNLQYKDVVNNVFLRKFMETKFRCSRNATNPSKKCKPDLRITERHGFFSDSKVSLVIDSVYAMVFGLNTVYMECIDVVSRRKSTFHRRDEILECVTQEKVVQAIRDVSFEGLTGEIAFDLFGSTLEKRFEIVNMKRGVLGNLQMQRVGIWYIDQVDIEGQVGSHEETDKRNVKRKDRGQYCYDVQRQNTIKECINITRTTQENDIDLDDLEIMTEIESLAGNLVMDTDAIYWPRIDPGEGGVIPESVCSRDCTVGSKRQFSTLCCWTCQRCRMNEITDQNQTNCITCPPHYWPDQSERKTCLKIRATRRSWGDTSNIIMIIFTAFGMSLATLILIVFVKYREDRLVKASSREMMFIMIAGLYVSFIVVFFFVSTPSVTSCYVDAFGLGLSFTMCYAPLLTKTRRIYVIFKSGSKTTQKPRFVGTRSQLVIAIVLIIIQIIISTIIAIASPPSIIREMPNPMEPHVEITCNVSIGGMIASICYNVCLILLCCAFAWKARGLPANFNETKFIMISVYTTLILWIAFIPSYFTASAGHHRVTLRNLALIINAYVTIICMFVPKLYAIFCANETSGTGKTGDVSQARDNSVVPSNLGNNTIVVSDADKVYKSAVLGANTSLDDPRSVAAMFTTKSVGSNLLPSRLMMSTTSKRSSESTVAIAQLES